MSSIVAEKQCFHCFSVLADETRIQILAMLKRSRMNVSSLTDEIGLTQPTVSYHLKMLDDIGLITKEKRGRETYYAFNKNYPCKGCGVFTAPIKL